MRLSDYVQKTGNFQIVETVKRYAQSDLRLAVKKGGCIMAGSCVGHPVDISYTDGVYLIYHTDKPIMVNGKIEFPQTIHYQGTDKKQAVNILMNLYDIQA